MSRLMKNLCLNIEYSFNSLFIRRVKFSLKIILAFILSGFIAYATPLKNSLDQQYIICVISILSIQETIGSTVNSAIQTIVSLVPLSIILFLIQFFGLSSKQYLITEILLLLLTFLIAYQCEQIQTRKITLLYNSIFFSTIINEQSLPILFVFYFLSLFLIGMSISIFISFTVFPLFSTIDIENRLNYSLKNLQQMCYLITQAFLTINPMKKKLLLSNVRIIEKMIGETIRMRNPETNFEPRRFIQKFFFHRRHRLTIGEELDLINSLLRNLSSVYLMIEQIQFDENHLEFLQRIQSSILYLNSSQSSLISSLISTKKISQEEFHYRLQNLVQSRENLYRNLQSNDYRSYGHILFQFFSIAQLLINTTNDRKPSQNKSGYKICFEFHWSKFFSALKSVMIIGVGSIFVMVPFLAKIFENGQWILIALCMTQAETVGGAFTTMKMRLIGTLLGSMYSYITYLLVKDQIFQTFLILIPWIFFFSYLRLFPKYSYTAAVASFTPILVNLGRLPYGDALPAGNYALLRIEQNLVAILIAFVLAMGIFPVYAIDSLKDNIQKSFQCCGKTIESISDVYDQLFHRNSTKIESIVDENEKVFEGLINNQRMLVSYASIEPTFLWFKNQFSSIHYNRMVDQQFQILTIFHHLHSSLIYLNEYPRRNSIENDLFSPMKKSLDICSNYFQSTKTFTYEITRGNFAFKRLKPVERDLIEYQLNFNELNEALTRFDDKISCLSIDEEILLPFSSMFYSMKQLANLILQLGITISEVFQLEITDFYQPF